MLSKHETVYHILDASQRWSYKMKIKKNEGGIGFVFLAVSLRNIKIKNIHRALLEKNKFNV